MSMVLDELVDAGHWSDISGVRSKVPNFSKEVWPWVGLLCRFSEILAKTIISWWVRVNNFTNAWMANGGAV